MQGSLKGTIRAALLFAIFQNWQYRVMENQAKENWNEATWFKQWLEMASQGRA